MGNSQLLYCAICDGDFDLEEIEEHTGITVRTLESILDEKTKMNSDHIERLSLFFQEMGTWGSLYNFQIEVDDATVNIEEEKEDSRVLDNLKTYKNLKTTLNKFKVLDRNWDGYEAKKIPDFVIARSLRCLASMEKLGIKPPFIAPSPDGEVLFYWTKRPKSDYIEFNVDKSENVSLIWREKGRMIEALGDCYESMAGKGHVFFKLIHWCRE